MTDLQDRLSAALHGRYTLERELGRGGMATVYLAHDLKHDRRVALKVLHPELAATLGPERFQREIRTTARLQHPHILPVLDSGEAAGQLWYTMPYVEGEGLRDRLRRERQLPIEDALQITREVADALGYAHRQNVVHRDIKPENILLSEGHALVADFGVARALHAAGGEQLTETGISVGTPAYMSPEQSLADPVIDGRSDLYSLGCVLYEMLAGEVPYTGTSAQAVVAKRLREPVPHVRTVRETVPIAVDEALERVLAKTPADRFPTAAVFVQALTAPRSEEAAFRSVSPTAPSMDVREVTRAHLGTRGWLLAALAAGGVAVLLGIRAWGGRGTDHLDAELLAVAPFDVLDPRLQLWREGMVDLLSRNFDGAGALRTVSPTAVVRRWSGRADKTSGEELARRTGARLVLYGTLVPVGQDSVRLSASVLDAARSQTVADGDLVGPTDHMDRLADSLTILILPGLGRTASATALRTFGLGSRSLPAVRSFLSGEQFFRRAEWDSARVSFERAVELDTGFALAYWRLGSVLGWLSPGDSLEHASRLRAGALNHGLAPRESLLVTADSLFTTLEEFGIPDSLEEQRTRRLFTTADEARRRYPTDPESWVALGEAQRHFGAGRGITLEMQLESFGQAIRLDSAYGPAYSHAVELAAMLDNRPAARRYATQYLAVHPSRTEAIAARTAVLLLDPGTSRAQAAHLLDTLPFPVLLTLINDFTYTPDSEEVGRLVWERFVARPASERIAGLDDETANGFFAPALAYRGHLRDAYAVIGRYPGMMAWGAYTGLALAGIVPPDSATAVFARQLRHSREEKASGVQQQLSFPLPWWCARQDTTAIRQYSERLKAIRSPSTWDRYQLQASAGYQALARRDTVDAIHRLESLPASGLVWYERLTLAHLLIGVHRQREALDLLGRGFPWGFQAMERATWALEDARLAEQFGQRDRARYGYGYVTRVWRHADPELQPLVAEAREALQRLTAEGTH